MFMAILFVTVDSFIWMYKHSNYFRNANPSWYIPETRPRACSPLSSTLSTVSSTSPLHICMASMTDAVIVRTSHNETSDKTKRRSQQQHKVRCRNFDALADLVKPNHERYAQRHGYRYTMAQALDTRRPPAWNKILVLQEQLALRQRTNKEPLCDWIMWLDADVVIMNPDITIESILRQSTNAADLILTPDRKFFGSSGVFLLRNSPWSLRFLDTWWTTGRKFVRAKGLSLSGDNHAMGTLVRGMMTKKSGHKEKEHIHMSTGRCTMNSNAVFVENGDLDVASKRRDWQGSVDYYHEGDFLAHAAGIDQKARAMELLLERAK